MAIVSLQRISLPITSALLRIRDDLSSHAFLQEIDLLFLLRLLSCSFLMCLFAFLNMTHRWSWREGCWAWSSIPALSLQERISGWAWPIVMESGIQSVWERKALCCQSVWMNLGRAPHRLKASLRWWIHLSTWAGSHRSCETPTVIWLWSKVTSL